MPTLGMLLARVRKTIRERALFAPGACVLVGCSGGPDSAALLHVLSRLGDLELHAASVDHGLRPDASRDVEVARSLAERLEIPFGALRVDVSPEGSLQARAREARYEALLARAGELGAVLAVGHTLDDQAETVLGRLLRGAGIAGLSGIDPIRADGVVRPLIDCRREQVRAHVSRFELPCVEDPSNVDERFLRTRIRHGLLPALAAEAPGIEAHLARLADEARGVSTWIERCARDGDGSLRELPGPVRVRAMALWIEQQTGQPAKRAHLEMLETGAEVLLPGGLVATWDGDRLEARPEPAEGANARNERRGPPVRPKETELGGLRFPSGAADD